MTKQYTPSIDEFHIEFEYIKDNVSYKIKNGTEIDNINLSEILVKYLDINDIISTGFDFIAESNDDKIFKRLVNEKNNPVIIELRLWYVGDFPFISIFEGQNIPLLQSYECKNKSELLCTLKRLRII